MYQYGAGVEQDYREAVRWYRKSAVQGVAVSQVILGRMYDIGEGVEQDYKEAVKWYRKAAEQGDAKGLANLGSMYGRGKGVAQNFKEAYIWFALAVELGEVKALESLSIAADQLSKNEIEQAQKEAPRRLADIEKRNRAMTCKGFPLALIFRRGSEKIS